MIRVVVFLIVVGALSFGVSWLADRPGDVVITWQGLRIETSLMVLVGVVAVLVALVVAIWSVIRALLRSPFAFANYRRNRRGSRAYEAISNGLIAIGAGDTAAARKHSAAVNRIASDEPLALLLSAQSAQLSGDRESAERVFRAMASRTDTKTLGLRGLFIEAQRRDDVAGARAYAEEAARTSPSLGWAGRAVLEFRCAAGDWAGALALLERGKAALDKAIYRRQRAVMLTAWATDIEETDRDMAKAHALEAVKLAPTLVPAAALAGRMLAEGGELRKASRVVVKAWRANPHPDLAQAYAELRFGDAARDHLARVEALIRKTPAQIEGALTVARAALDAREFGKARAALARYLAAPTKRVALLMADLERAEHNDEGRAREWLARALNAAPDPQWTADGHVSDRWLPISPVTGRLDAFEWRVPFTGTVTTPVIESMPQPASSAAAETEQQPPAEREAARHEPEPHEPARDQPEPAAHESKASAPSPEAAAPSANAAGKWRAPASSPVIPLVHAPDDPGPDNVEDSESPPQASGWRKAVE